MKVMTETNVVIMNMNRGPTAIMNGSNHGSKSDMVVVAPTLIHRGKSTAIYLTPHENKGIKVIDDIHPTEEQVLRLIAEEHVSRFLPPRCKRRRVIQVKSFQGNPALHFEWAPGNSIKLWLQSEENKEAGLRDRLRIATSITKTLLEFHEGNVCVQNLDLENIILDISRSVVHHCVDASLINLSSAVVVLDISEDEVKILEKKDLQDLGYILNVVFRGELNSDSSEKTRRASMEGGEDADTDDKYEYLSSTRGKRGKAISPGEGLPVYLTSLISTLIQPSTECYKDVKSVLHDLQIANRKFDIYLNPSINRDPQVLLHFKIPDNAFYGRESELAMLLQSFNSTIMVNGQTTLTCVSGHSGMGKTSLINQIKPPLKAAKGYMIRGKFDPSARPDAVLHLALNSFFGEIMNEARDEQDEMVSRIQESFGSRVGMLTESIPNLAKLLGVEEGLESNAGSRCQQQWKFLLCTLMAAIPTEKHPIVCFFDDLQWADEASLDTIQLLALDCDVRYCHYLLSFRDDEDEPTRRVTSIIDKIELQGVPVTKIKLGPIPVDTVNAMCSENLYLPPSLCRSLSTAVHNKAGGIMLFVVNLLKSLSSDGLLRFNASLGRFEYNIQLVQMDGLDFEGVSNYLTHQMIQLPSKVLLCLKVAACFGFVIDTHNLTSTLNGLDIDLEVLDQLISYGYLQRPCSDQFQFSHDQVHQAAYSLIDSTKKKSFHLLIGSRLLIRNREPEDLENAVFDIVHHMSEGASLLHSHPSPTQRNEVAGLNVVAGEKAIKSSSFSSAAKYFEAALSLHGEDGDYDFLMKVYGLLQLPLFAIGDFTRLETIIDKTLSLSRTFEEKRPSYLCLVKVLSAKGQLQETITMGHFVLEELGEPIPDQPTMNLVFHLKKDVESTLSDYSDDKILSLPHMADDKKLFAMDFLSKLLYVAFFAKPLCLPIIGFRMIKLSLNYGLCELSAIAFSVYGALLVNQSAPDFEEGARNGRIAISIMKQFDSKAVLARVYTNVYGTINLWREPLQASLDKHLEAYNEGALAGDMEYAVTSLLQYSSLALCGCGDNLETLEIRTRKHVRKAIQYKLSMVAKCLVVTHSHILDLIGGSEDSYATYMQCTEDEFYQEAQDNNEGMLCRIVPGKRLFLSLFLGDMVAAEKWFKIRQTYKASVLGVSPRFIGPLTAEFHASITALHLARKKGRADQDELIAAAEESIDLFRRGASSSNWNFSHKLSLLEAEKAFTNGDEEKAQDCYKAAITAAKAHRFVHEEGLANERASRFYHHYGRVDEALLHLNQAKDCYEKWGALALSKRMEQEIELLHESTS